MKPQLIRRLLFDFLVTGSLISIPIGGSAEELDEKQLRRCMLPIVLQTKEIKGLDFNSHKFNCRGISGWKTTDGVTAIRGRLAHHLSGRPDDQVNWSFNLDSSGVVSDVTLNIKRGGAGSIVRRITPPVITQRGIPINPDGLGVEKFFKWTGEIWDGSWESVAYAIVGGITTHLSLARAAAKSGDIQKSPIFHYDIAPWQSGPYMRDNSQDPYSCRDACQDSRTCQVWSFQNRKISNGQAGELRCMLFSGAAFRGFRSQTRSITGRIRDADGAGKSSTASNAGSAGTNYSGGVGLSSAGKALATPINLAISNLAKTSLRLSWTDVSNSEDGFIIERAVAGYQTRWEMILKFQNAGDAETSGTGERSIDLRNQPPGVAPLCYRVSAFSGQNETKPTESKCTGPRRP